MRVIIQRRPVESALRWTQRVLFACAFLLIGYSFFVMASSWMFQRHAKQELNQKSSPEVTVAPKPAEGAVLGEVDVDRLGVSVAVVEGADASELAHAAGHVSGTALPGETGNVGIAAHRDTFFRPLRKIRRGDIVRVTTPAGEYRYRVVSTKIVSPDDVSVLDPDGEQTLTLITCYPFYYIGAAPNRFIVRADREKGSVDGAEARALQPPTPHAHL